MKHDWERLEAWLLVNEAKTLTDLNPPVTTAEIQKLKGKLGCGLPPGYLECLEVHAGQQGKAQWLFDGREFLSVGNVLLSWDAWNDLADGGDLAGLTAKPGKGIQPVWWSKSWIPFASNGGGDFLCLDMAPAAAGRSGQVIEIFHDFPDRKVLSPDFDRWFKEFVDARAGQYGARNGTKNLGTA
jgi:cell wall assembly regulator SMI1